MIHSFATCSSIIFSLVLLGVERPADLYVSPEGNDSWSGKLNSPNADQTDGPFASLERARDELRRWKHSGTTPSGGITVELRAGRYSRFASFDLTEQDSGTPESPIRWRGEQGESACITGGPAIVTWSSVEDPEILQRLDPAVRGKVLQADLKKQGVNDFGEVDSNRLELFYDNRPMIPARYPNEGFLEIAEVLGPTPREIHGKKGVVEGSFAYSDDRPSRWQGEPEAWLHGYWFWDWADQRQKIGSIDLRSKSISLIPPHHHYGYRKGQWYYAFNILSELDAPGEWYLNRQNGILYFYPPDPGEISNHSTVVSVSSGLVTLSRVLHVEFSNMVFECSREIGINATDSKGIRIDGCLFRNIGGNAVHFDQGEHNAIINSDVTDIGHGGVVVTGGDFLNLKPSNHLVDNCLVTRYGRWKPMYSAGISVNGVGIKVAHNRIHDAPHIGILFRGNDHLIELNEIHHVCQESNDAGAIYSGRNWTWRGTVIRHNHLHHITGFRDRGCLGVYLDDMLCGTTVFGNLFFKVNNATAICGGRDCRIENNIFVDCRPAIHIDDRALHWASYHAQEWINEAKEKGTISGIAYKQPPYNERYPELSRIIEEDPAAPRGNVITRNLQWQGTWVDLSVNDKTMLQIDHNFAGEDPGFIDARNENFQLRDDSTVYANGFRKLPIEIMGLDATRRGAVKRFADRDSALSPTRVGHKDSAQ